MKGLTPRQRRVLTFLVEYHEAHGWPPTRREICSHIGSVNPSAANDHLIALERKGYLRQVPRISRGLIVTPQGRGVVNQHCTMGNGGPTATCVTSTHPSSETC